jgi:hypothetical protein
MVKALDRLFHRLLLVFIIVTFKVGVELGWIRQVYFEFHDLVLEGVGGVKYVVAVLS